MMSVSFEITFPQGFVPIEGEQVLSRYAANWRQRPYRATGGALYLTSHRMLFSPISLEVSLGGKKWWADREDVTSIDTVGINPVEIFSGGIRRRLRVSLRNGEFELFVVGQLFGPIQLDLIVAELRSWILPGDS